MRRARARTSCWRRRSRSRRRSPRLHDDDSSACDLLRPRQPDERARRQRVHASVVGARRANTAPALDPRDLRPLVSAGHARHRDGEAAHDSRLRRFSARAVRGAVSGARRSGAGVARARAARTGRARRPRRPLGPGPRHVVQLAIDETQPPEFHYELGKRLAPLRDEGVLIAGSGNVVHNLHAYAWGRHVAHQFDWAVRFESRARELLAAREHEPLIDYESMGEDAVLSVPTPEHYLPLLYVIATQQPGESATFPVEGGDGGSISMLSVEIS